MILQDRAMAAVTNYLAFSPPGRRVLSKPGFAVVLCSGRIC
jgi:hypothetical protein